MKAIILAAGVGKRLRPLTNDKPKPMVEVSGKPILHHIWDTLPKEISEVVLVVGYKAEKIREYFGDEFGGRKVRYVLQDQPLGTGAALLLCKNFIANGEKFLFLYADDLHSKKSVGELLKHDCAMLVYKHADPSRFGVVEVGLDGKVASLEEKPARSKSNLVSVGVYVLPSRIFNYAAAPNVNGEIYATDMVNQLMVEQPVYAVQSDFWHPIGYPEDVASAEQALRYEKQ